MKKVDRAAVWRIAPWLSQAQADAAVEILTVAGAPLAERLADDAGSLAAAALDPPARDRHGLTAAMREANDFADARGLPVPFPPR